MAMSKLFHGGWLVLLATLATWPALAQRPAPTAKSKSTLPPLPPRRVPNFPELPPNPTRAETNENERRRWNFFLTDSIWRRKRFNYHPNALLVAAVQGRKPGTALDVGMGEGRNALYLAQHGWRVTGVDVAERALNYAQARANKLGVRLTTVAQDADAYDWGTARWDLIVLSYAGGRDYAERVKKALRPGGLLVLEAFHTDAAQASLGAIGPDVLFGPDELKQLYAGVGLQIIRYEEPLGVADFGKETVRLVKLVAQQPPR